MAEQSGYSTAKKTDDTKLLELAKKRFQNSAEAEAEIRKLSLEDRKFAAGGEYQWPDGVMVQRTKQGRPCLTINKIPQFTQQVTNEQRQNRPSIQVNPVNDGGDQDTAEVIQGLVRHIEYDSAADQAYDSAFEDAVTSGYGFVRVITQYAEDLGFDQEIKIKRVRNPFAVYGDPDSQEVDWSDARYCFVVERMPKEEYTAAYPDSELATSVTAWGDSGEDGWVNADSCQVAEYFYKEEISKEIELFSDGTVELSSAVTDELRATLVLRGVKGVAKRTTKIPFIKWVKFAGSEVLERADWPGRWIPIVPIIGKEIDLDGKRILKGIVRDSMDPQRQFNYMESAATEMIALAPKSPFVAYEGQLEGHEREWQNMNVTNTPVLTVKAVTVGGQPAPLPQRQQAEPPIQAMAEMIARAADDMKSTTGIYDASLGARSNETSGKGILARQQQSQSGNFHFIDNLSRALRQIGRIVVDLIPKVYDAKRVVRIIGEDGKQSTVTINNTGPTGELPPGVTNVYDLGVGKYDVTISTGPSYQTKRQEAVNSMASLISAYPAIMQIAGDLVVGEMDWPGAKQIAERLFKSIPPNLTAEDAPMEGVPPEVQQKFSQIMQQMQALQQENQQLQQEQKMQMAPKLAELESQERIEFAKIAEKSQYDMRKLDIDAAKVQADLLTAQTTIDAQRADNAIDREVQQINLGKEQAHEFAMSQVPTPAPAAQPGQPQQPA